MKIIRGRQATAAVRLSVRRLSWVHRNTLSRWEHGGGGVSAYHHARIQEAFRETGNPTDSAKRQQLRQAHSGRKALQSPRTLSWYEAIATPMPGRKWQGRCHSVTYLVYQGHNQKGDVDNYAKCILDSLVRATILKSDASVVEIHGYKFRDKDNPRTEIEVIGL